MSFCYLTWITTLNKRRRDLGQAEELVSITSKVPVAAY